MTEVDLGEVSGLYILPHLPPIIRPSIHFSVVAASNLKMHDNNTISIQLDGDLDLWAVDKDPCPVGTGNKFPSCPVQAPTHPIHFSHATCYGPTTQYDSDKSEKKTPSVVSTFPWPSGVLIKNHESLCWPKVRRLNLQRE